MPRKLRKNLHSPNQDISPTQAAMIGPYTSPSSAPQYDPTDLPGPANKMYRYIPPYSSDQPDTFFICEYDAVIKDHRYIHRVRRDEFLIYTDGACLFPNTRNYTANHTAGCAFVYRDFGMDAETKIGSDGCVVLQLEKEGFDGKTSFRAELRAVLAALSWKEWDNEGCKHMVIATDSEYVIKGATIWMEDWLANDWEVADGEVVKNRDLWQDLLTRVVQLHKRNGLRVSFWHIDTRLNERAAAAAKKAIKRENSIEPARK